MSRRGFDTRPKQCDRHNQSKIIKKNNSQWLFEFEKAYKAVFIFPSTKHWGITVFVQDSLYRATYWMMSSRRKAELNQCNPSDWELDLLRHIAFNSWLVKTANSHQATPLTPPTSCESSLYKITCQNKRKCSQARLFSAICASVLVTWSIVATRKAI